MSREGSQPRQPEVADRLSKATTVDLAVDDPDTYVDNPIAPALSSCGVESTVVTCHPAGSG